MFCECEITNENYVSRGYILKSPAGKTCNFSWPRYITYFPESFLCPFWKGYSLPRKITAWKHDFWVFCFTLCLTFLICRRNVVLSFVLFSLDSSSRKAILLKYWWSIIPIQVIRECIYPVLHRGSQNNCHSDFLGVSQQTVSPVISSSF